MNILSQFRTPITDTAIHNITPHEHQFWQIDYYESAPKTTAVLNGETFTFRNKQQPLIIIPPYVTHKITTQAPYVCYALKFESDFEPFSKIPHCIIPLNFDEELTGKILSATEYKDETETLILGRLLDILMLKILKSRGISVNISKTYSDTRVEKAIMHINDNLLEMPSTEDIAGYMNMSITHFCRIFKKETGLSPMEYQRGMIIKKAEKMLKYTDLTVSQIADTFKFSDIHTFSRTFKRINGVSPKEYRNNEAKI